VRIAGAYTNDAMSHTLQPGENVVKYFRLERSFGWYDFTLEVESDPSFTQRLAGHLETGEGSMTDPAIAAS
jgi:phospholipase C